MSLKRLLVVCLAVAASIVFVPGASAGNFDEERMGCTGEDPATCPTGTTNQSYSLRLYLLEDQDLACAVFSDSGGLPPGLSLAPTDGIISGTPTQAGNFGFYLTVTYNREATCPFKNPSDDRFIIPINQGAPVPPPLPRLTIGPEQSGVRNGTVGTAYSLTMTASVDDPKTWSISAGALPPGLTLGASDGVISGTPTSAGSYAFTIHAATTGSRSDTKALTIEVRNPLEIAASAPFDVESPVRSEVGVKFDSALVATGGFGTYTWSLVGDVPPGLTFDPFAGTLTGRTTESGTYRFTVSVADSEGRSTAYAARILVAERLAIRTLSFRSGKVGFFYSAKLRSFGGVGPVSWRVKRGPLPRGITFDRTTAKFFGTPTRPGTWRISVEVVDSLRVKSTATITITVGSRLKPRTSG